MKKLFTSLFLLLLTISTTCVKAITYDDAIAQKKPCAILIYADWADNINSVSSTFNELEKSYVNQYNFVKINISKEEAKAFNKTNYIYPNLPYVMLYKERGRISRYLPQSCVFDSSCIKDKMDLFAN